MDRSTETIKDLELQLKRWKNWSRPPNTKIHYAELRLKRLKAAVPKPPKADKRKTKDSHKPPLAKPCPENTAYVLHREIYDLTQAMVALERLR